MQQRRLSNSLAELGLRRFMDDNYALYGGYVKLVKMLEGGANNAEIARAFSPVDRPLSRHAVRRWRAQYQLELEEARA